MYSIQFRTYFSIQHLKSAHLLCQESKAVESEFNLVNDIHEKSMLISKNNAYATSSILSSLAFIEAVINEVVCDICDGTERITSIPLNERKIIKEKWITGNLDRNYPIKKYNEVLKILNCDTFDKASDLYQNIEVLISLRNTLIHYKPEWYSTHSSHLSETENQHFLTDRLIGKFEFSTMFKNTGNPFFPDKCIGYGCSIWAIRNVLSFSDAFHKRIGLKPIYEHIRNELLLQ